MRNRYKVLSEKYSFIKEAEEDDLLAGVDLVHDIMSFDTLIKCSWYTGDIEPSISIEDNIKKAFKGPELINLEKAFSDIAQTLYIFDNIRAAGFEWRYGGRDNINAIIDPTPKNRQRLYEIIIDDWDGAGVFRRHITYHDVYYCVLGFDEQIVNRKSKELFVKCVQQVYDREPPI